MGIYYIWEIEKEVEIEKIKEIENKIIDITRELKILKKKIKRCGEDEEILILELKNKLKLGKENIRTKFLFLAIYDKAFIAFHEDVKMLKMSILNRESELMKLQEEILHCEKIIILKEIFEREGGNLKKEWSAMHFKEAKNE